MPRAKKIEKSDEARAIREADMAEFGERLVELRKARGLSQGALATEVGVNINSIVKYEKGEREPGWFLVQMIADVLGVPATELLPAKRRGSLPIGKMLEHVDALNRLLRSQI